MSCHAHLDHLCVEQPASVAGKSVESLDQRLLVGDAQQHVVQAAILDLASLQVADQLTDLDRARELVADIVQASRSPGRSGSNASAR